MSEQAESDERRDDPSDDPSEAPPSPEPAAPPSLAQRALRRAAPYALPLLLSTLLARAATGAILERAGHPAMPLDDSFIHLVYAKHLSMGRWFEYVLGEGYSTGATSFLWPLLLTPFLLVLKADPLAPIWGTWILGTLLHAATAVETGRVTARLAGRAPGVTATLMSLGFGAFAWFAWSGMETLLFAWLFVRTVRLASRALDGPGPGGPAPLFGDATGRLELAVFGALAALSRPEGAIAAGLAMVALGVLAVRARSAEALDLPSLARRFAGPAAGLLLGLLLVPLSHLAMTGHAASSTTLVKWLPANPHYSPSHLRGAIQGHLELLFRSILDGGDWTHLFVPQGSRLVLLAAALVLPLRAARAKAPWTGVLAAALALSAIAPTTYMSFLWNRVRYVWPFATGWFVLAACLALELGYAALWLGAAAHRLRGLGLARPGVSPAALGAAFGGAFAGLLAAKLPRALDDLAESAHAIDRQQVALGRWASEHLPADARIGVNDTGAIAYLSRRKTFDVVGLTTEGEAPYWVSGAGPRFEHYERLARDQAGRERLPTHFIVYPQWMACSPVLGEELHQATVTDQSILGGATMVAYEARWDLLGSGALPATMPESAVPKDELDVADLLSEKEHGVSPIGLWDGHTRASILGLEALVVDGTPVLRRTGDDLWDRQLADGGRAERAEDAFRLDLPAGASTLVMRVASEEPTVLVVSLGDEGREAGKLELPGLGWTERKVALPAGAGGKTLVRVSARGARFTSYHYWVYGGPS